ncbi:MAG: DMT family transporter [Angustibacter sp.]
MSRRAVLLFVSLSIAWGVPYLLIKIAITELDAITLVFLRTFLGAVLLLPVAVARGWVRPVLRQWPRLLVFTVVEISAPWLLLTRAEQHLSSSLTGLLIAAVPLVAVAVALVIGRPDPLGIGGVVGLLVGMAGVALLVGVDVRGSAWSAVAQMGVVVVGYAVGAALLARWFADLPGPGVVAVALTAAAIGYLPFALPGLATVVVEPPSAGVITCVVLLATICTAGAFLLLVALVAEIGPVRATTITYVNPAVAVVAGAVVLDEPVTWWTAAGFGCVVAGSVLVNHRRPVERPADVKPDQVSAVTAC